MTKLYCSYCKINYIEHETNRFYRCYSCREKIPTGESIREKQDYFKDYHYHFDNKKSSRDVWFYGQAKYWWECPIGHIFLQSPKNLLDGFNCNKCFRRKSFTIDNSLLNKFPDLASEWNYSINVFTPLDYSFGSGEKVWWKCQKCSHEWEASIKSRTNKSHRNGCPKCAELSQRSKGEIQVYEYIAIIYSDEILTNTRSIIPNGELDIYIPKLSIAIEYNGDYWHSDGYLLKKYGKDSQTYHQEKYLKCHEKSIKLYYIWEHDWENKTNLIKYLLELLVEEGPVNLENVDYSMLEKLA